MYFLGIVIELFCISCLCENVLFRFNLNEYLFSKIFYTKQSMKQMTLFDLSKKKGMKTPDKKKSGSLRTPEKGIKTPDRPIKSPRARTPAIVSKMVRAFKQKEETKLKTLAIKAAKLLTLTQMKKLPVEVKDIVNKRFEFMQEKKKM